MGCFSLSVTHFIPHLIFRKIKYFLEPIVTGQGEQRKDKFFTSKDHILALLEQLTAATQKEALIETLLIAIRVANRRLIMTHC